MLVERLVQLALDLLCVFGPLQLDRQLPREQRKEGEHVGCGKRQTGFVRRGCLGGVIETECETESADERTAEKRAPRESMGVLLHSFVLNKKGAWDAGRIEDRLGLTQAQAGKVYRIDQLP